jgi:hypothetical protein
LKSVTEQQREDSGDSSDTESYFDESSIDFDDEKIPTLEEREVFLRRMSKMMVEQKIKKINCLVDIYQYINKNLVDQICFMSNKARIDQLVKEHSQGGINIETELEIIMIEEAYEFITVQFEAKH